MKDWLKQLPGKSSMRAWIILGALALIVFRFLLVRVVVADPSCGIFIDSGQYLELARNLLDNGTYQSDVIPDLDLLRSPGYPIFLTIILGITGGSLHAVLIVQFLLVFFTAYCLYELGNILGQQKVGLIAGLFLLLSPNTLFWSCTIMTECLFAFGLTLAFLWIVKSFKYNSTIWPIGILFGILTLIRPIGLYLIFLWTCWILIYGYKKIGKKQALKRSVSYFVPAVIVILPWFVRNYYLHGDFTLSSVSSMTVSSFHLALTLEEAEDMSWDEAKVRIAERDNTWSWFTELITSYPGAFMKVQLKGIARSLIGTEVGTWSRLALNTEYKGSGILDVLIRGDFESMREVFNSFRSIEELPQALFLLWGSGYSIFLFVLVGFGVVRLVRYSDLRIHGSIILALITIIYLLISPGAAGEARFRVPAEPFLAFLAALAFYSKPCKGKEETPNSHTKIDFPQTSKGDKTEFDNNDGLS